MKTQIALLLSICMAFGVYAQPDSKPSAAKAKDGDAGLLESKIRQAWEDYKTKNKDAFSRIFTDDAIEVEEGAEGPHDLKATLAEMDEVNLTTYALSDFHFRPIRPDGMLVRYDVDYTASMAGKPVHNKSIVGEVWEKTSGDWKLLYFQETKIR
jgi:hypothetical protein